MRTRHWNLVSDYTINGDIPVTKYVSKKTGLTVTIATVQSPIVKGLFCVTTEASTDDGLPHTLEHLIFLGSDAYPYKNTLGLLARRSLARHVNAWTARDQTCYTVDTVGSKGFLNILPPYLDHIFFPLLRDEHFVTEVHHINGKGEDAGVVYSEMQAIENERNAYFETMKKVYPGNNGFTKNTGGKLKNLRQNTTIENIREYHKHFYRPDNANIIITGSVEPENVFEALEAIEDKMLRTQTKRPLFERPFMTELEPLTESETFKIEFPDKEEKFGSVSLYWRLPQPLLSLIQKMYGLQVMGSYLTHTSDSLLRNAFVEVDKPLATGVGFHYIRYAEPTLALQFSGVPKDRIEEIEPLFNKTMHEFMQEGEKGLDLAHMHRIIKRNTQSHEISLRDDPYKFFTSNVYRHGVYGRSDDDLQKLFDYASGTFAEPYLNQSASYWMNLLQETLSLPRISSLNYPSKKFNDELLKTEKDRIKKQIQDLGPSGLKLAKMSVDAAVNSIPSPPESVLEGFPFADVDEIVYRPLKYYNQSTKEQPEGYNITDMPIRTHIDDVNTDVVRFYLFFDVQQVPHEDRNYVILLMSLWFSSPLKIDDTFVPLSVLERNITEKTLSFGSKLGYGGLEEIIVFSASCTRDNYEAVVNMMRHVLFNVEFTTKKAKTVVSRIITNIERTKSSGLSVLSYIFDIIAYNKKTYRHYSSFLRKKAFMENVLKNINEKPQELFDKLTLIRKSLLNPKKALLYLSTDIDRLRQEVSDPLNVWKTFFDASKEFPSKEEKSKHFESPPLYTFTNEEPQRRHIFVPHTETKSCYLTQSIMYPMNGWDNPEMTILRVMLNYLQDQMSNEIRGKGLAYSAGTYGIFSGGQIALYLHRSAQLVDAYEEFRNLLRTYTSENSFTNTLMDSAKGSMVYSFANKENTISSFVRSSLLSYLRSSHDPFYHRRVIQQIMNTTTVDVERVAKTYLKDFLDPSKTKTVIVCNPNDAEKVRKGFEDFGFDLETIDDLENSILTQ